MVVMKTRYLQAAVAQLCFASHKMAFVAGPRQCGKTTMAKLLLARRAAGVYHNWDDVQFRRQWVKQPSGIIPAASDAVPLVVLDEIHKAKGWKRTLKGVYDTQERPADLLVTGSARLNVYRKGGDSLSGRYFLFRMHPFTLGELTGSAAPSPDDALAAIFQHGKPASEASAGVLDTMLRFGGFPEPFLGQDERKARLWRRNRIDTIIREDVRDLTRIPELGRIEMLAALIPERVGSPFSMAALREDLEVSFDTVRRWTSLLKDLYYLYEVKPFYAGIARSLRKEGKVYLWDFSEVDEPGPRFENLVANHLLKACHFWTDTGEGAFELFYIRNKEKQELDFLIVRDRKPWLPVEVKLSDTGLSPHWRKFLPALGCLRGMQLVRTAGVWQEHPLGAARVTVASAGDVLARLP
jgi:predicted AAA+ superfamily ATPase